MTRRYRSAPAVLVVVATIALFAAHRGDADPPPAASTNAVPARAVLPVQSPATTAPAVELDLKPGDASGEESPSLRQSVATAGTRPIVIHLSAGTFNAADLAIGPGGSIRIVGTRGPAGSPLSQNTVVTGPIKITGRDVTVDDVIFSAPSTPGLQPGKSAADTVVTISKSPHVQFDRCLFTGSADTGLAIDHAANWAVNACLFDDIYRGLFVTAGNNGRLVNCTLVDDRLGHGTNSLTTGRIQIVDSDHLVLFNNALSPRDPDGKILLLDGCGNDIHSDYNIWNGVITHQYGTEQQSTWQNSFRTLDSWQAHTAAMWGSACDTHSHSEPIDYCHCPDSIPGPDSKALGECSGAAGGTAAFQGVSSPSTDLLGRATDHSIGCINLAPPKVPLPFDPAPGARVFSVKFPTPGRASVAVYDGEWLLKTITAGRLFDAGNHTFVWDGRDNTGQPVRSNPGTKITWRAVLTPDGPAALDIAGPGMKLAPGCTGTTLANNPQENGEGIWCDKDGNLYEVAPYDEAGSTILSVDQDGHYRWRNWQHNGTLVTGDDKYIYVIGDTKPIEDGKVAKGTVLLERFPLSGCDPVPWADGTSAIQIGTADSLTPMGIAAGGGNLYVSDGPRHRVLVYTSGANKPSREIQIPSFSVAGVCLREDGSLLVCGRGNPQLQLEDDGWRVFSVAPNGIVSEASPNGLFSPWEISPGPGGQFFVLNKFENRWESIDPLPTAGTAPRPFELDHQHPDRAGLARLPITHIAGSKNALWVRQKEAGYARCRLTRFDREPDGSLKLAVEILSLEGQNGGFADPHDPSSVYSPDFFRYHVDLNTGQWTCDRNDVEVRSHWVGTQVGCSTGAVFYLGDKRFIATTVCNSPTTTSRTVLICRDDGQSLTPCAAVGGQYLFSFPFPPELDASKIDWSLSGQWSWTKTNRPDETVLGETQFPVARKNKDGMPFPDCTWGTYVERDGTIVWPGDSIHYLRPRGLDKTGSVPVYDWSDVVTIKYQDFPDRDEKFTARVDLDGSIYDLSTTKAQPLPPGYWGMGTVLSRLTPAGRRLWTVPVNLTAKGLAIDDKFVYVGSCFGPFINQYTKDGLLVRQISLGKTDSQFGWFDFPTPINSVTDPKTGDSVITAEEQWMGRIMVLKVPGTVTRLSGEVP